MKLTLLDLIFLILESVYESFERFWSQREIKTGFLER